MRCGAKGSPAVTADLGAIKSPFQRYRIAELVIDYAEVRSNEWFGRAVRFRVVPSLGDVGFLAELLIDGKTEEAIMIS